MEMEEKAKEKQREEEQQELRWVKRGGGGDKEGKEGTRKVGGDGQWQGGGKGEVRGREVERRRAREDGKEEDSRKQEMNEAANPPALLCTERQQIRVPVTHAAAPCG